MPSLRALKTAGYELAGVFTQPDRPKGRGKALSEPAVKVCAVELGLDVYQFERIKSAEGVAALKKTAPELMGYGGLRSDTFTRDFRDSAFRLH